MRSVETTAELESVHDQLRRTYLFAGIRGVLSARSPTAEDADVYSLSHAYAEAFGLTRGTTRLPADSDLNDWMVVEADQDWTIDGAERQLAWVQVDLGDGGPIRSAGGPPRLPVAEIAHTLDRVTRAIGRAEHRWFQFSVPLEADSADDLRRRAGRLERWLRDLASDSATALDVRIGSDALLAAEDVDAALRHLARPSPAPVAAAVPRDGRPAGQSAPAAPRFAELHGNGWIFLPESMPAIGARIEMPWTVEYATWAALTLLAVCAEAGATTAAVVLGPAP